MKKIKELTHTKLINYCTKNLVSASVDTSILECSQILNEQDIHHLPIMDSKGAVVGILSAGDLKVISNVQMAEKLSAKDLMTTNPVAALETSDFGEVCRQMLKSKIDSILIKNSQGTVVGIFTVTDALRALHDLLGEEVPSETSSSSSVILF